MNSSRFWVGIVLCLPALGCQLTISHHRSCPSVSCVAHAAAADCSGLAGSPPDCSTTSSTAPRLPHGYRWNEYQGADIEHDIYGDRQGAFYHHRPGCRTCFAARPAGCTTIQKSAPTADCGCEQHLAPPLPPPPVPVPLQAVPMPVEAEPMEPALVEPTPLEPTPAAPPVEPTPIEPATPAEPPAAEPTPATPSEPAPVEPMPENPQPAQPNTVPPRNEIPKQSVPTAKAKESGRLIPTQITPAAPLPGLPASRNVLRQNTIPTVPAKDATNGVKANSGGFLYDLMLGPQK